MNNLPERATLRKAENGIEWYVEKEGSNTIHYMMFNGPVLSGNWCGPQWIFHVLASMTPDERASLSLLSHDECMGEIGQRVRLLTTANARSDGGVRELIVA